MGYSLTDTFSSMIDEVITSLQGYGTDNDQVCTLSNSLTANAGSFSVDDTDGVSRGIIEIDDEIMYVNHAENGTIYVPPWGRGFKGTTPSTHAAYSAVWVAPTWPRATVARELNNTIKAVYPDLFGVDTFDLVSSSATWQYPVPSDVERILAVEWRWNVPNGWETMRAWEMVHSAQVSDFPTGKAILLGDAIPSGANVHVTYAKVPVALTSQAALFTDSGLPASSRDVIILGTASRLLPWQDTARLPVESVASDALDNAKPVGSATSVANAMRTQYQARLESERRSLFSRYPMRSHLVR